MIMTHIDVGAKSDVNLQYMPLVSGLLRSHVSSYLGFWETC